jgi:hypothetical protein
MNQVQQQPNFSDCGIYLLQYVESFFRTPISDYTLPITSLRSWFPEEEVRLPFHQCGGSGMFIPDPKTATKERDEKKFCETFFCSHKFHKIVIILFLKCRRKKFGPIFKELLNFLPKNCH